MIDRTSFAGTGVRIEETSMVPRGRSGSRRLTIGVMVALGMLALLGAVLAPVHPSSAKPTYEQDCSGCHDPGDVGLVVSGLPTSYTPGSTYTITISVNDVNGASGENGFYITLVGGGTLQNPGSGAEINDPAASASAADTRPMTQSSWTLEWVAPASGQVTLHVWAVSATDTLTGTSAPYSDQTVVLNSTAIPEFPTALLPALGVVGSILVISILRRKRPQ